MATDLETSERSVSMLVRGIIDDTGELLKQQMALLRAEIRADLRKTKQAAIALGLGVAVCVIGGLSLWLAVVHLLHDLVPKLPMSACYGIVAGALLLIGGVALYFAARKLRSFRLMPDESVEALKENLQWLKNPRQSASR
jgi:hypothetical protein